MSLSDYDREALAYLAGVLDSDGFITIRRHAANSQYGNSFTFSEHIGVGQAAPHAVSDFQRRWGGSLKLRRRQTEGNWRPLYYWTVTNRLEFACVIALRPWLRIKSRQADLLLSIRASKMLPREQQRTVVTGFYGGRARALSPDIIAAREAAWREVRSLNDRRPSNLAFAP